MNTYDSHWRDDPYFDCTNTLRAAPHLLCPVADRETLLLVDWAELTYDQAALALDVPVGTVRSRLNRARRKIREALDDITSVPSEEHRHD